MMAASEEQLSVQLAQYMRLKYPNVLFHYDYGSGAKLTTGQAIRQKHLNGGRRAWPDLFIAEPRVDSGDSEFPIVYMGLFIELKRDGTRLKRRDGNWASQHICEQAYMLQRLSERHYLAKFATGFDDAKQLIDDYLRKDKL